jgi:uncharacterized repeat protein (TIGR02543 family)
MLGPGDSVLWYCNIDDPAINDFQAGATNTYTAANNNWNTGQGGGMSNLDQVPISKNIIRFNISITRLNPDWAIDWFAVDYDVNGTWTEVARYSGFTNISSVGITNGRYTGGATFFQTNNRTLSFAGINGSTTLNYDAVYAQPIAAPSQGARLGYTFAGWSPSVPATMPNANSTYTAQWTANSYTVNFDANGGSAASPASKTVTYDSAYGALAATSLTGYTLNGWYTAPSGGTLITSASTVTTASNHTLYAQWTQNDYSYTFDAGGGTGGTSGTLHYGDPVTVPTVTRIGYTFTGWLEGAPPATMPDNAIYYTAQWQAYSYTVAYDANGGTGATASSSHTYDVPKALTVNGFSRLGWTFLGWSTTPGGSVEYTNGQEVSNLTGENGTTVTLYAVWSQNSYTYNFIANGGTGGTSGTLHYGDPVVVPTVTRTGYTFGFWAEGDPPATMPANNILFTAVWFVHTYTVTYNGNGSTGGSTANSAHTYDTSKALTTNGFTKTGFSFTGWSTTPGGAVEYADGASVINLTAQDEGFVTLYATWSAIEYSFTFDANGGTGGTSGTLHYGDPVVVPTVTRPGYTFVGWGEGVPPAFMPAESISYSAVWTANYYTVTYNGNGATGGSTADSSHRYNIAKVLTTNGYTRIGGIFQGWSATPGGNVQYANGQSVLGLTTQPNGIVTLYAVWYLIDYDFTFDANGGTGGTSGTLHYGDPVVVPTVTRTGYTFTGWAEETPPETMPANAISYTAQWSINSYWIAFDANGGTGGTEPALMEYNSTLTAPAVEKTGYTLAGWTPGVPATVPAGDTTYTAQWNPNSYTSHI